MVTVRRTLTDPATYRRLLYLLSAFPLGQVWFVLLVTVWSLCLGLVITPLVIPLALLLAVMTRAFASVEAAIAGALLDVQVQAPPAPARGRFWTWFRGQFGGGFWRAQAYLVIRWLAGLTVSVVLFSLLVTALGLIFAPAWIPFVHGGAHLGIWRPHTFVQSLALVPVGVILLPATLMIVGPLASPFRGIAEALLPSGAVAPGGDGAARERRPGSVTRRGLEAHAAIDGTIVFTLIVIWALTSRGYFWPVWVALPFALALAIHAWFYATAEQPALVERFRGSRALARTCGVAVALSVFFFAIWAITSRGYFWPVWPILGIALVVPIYAAAVLMSAPRSVLTERIETLESSRAGAVDVQESDLRRIERDLHDGAQARLVALGMSLGMAEQQLSEDPQRAGELLAEARVGAEEALRELRDLARGIHPPVLSDRGLEAALQALVGSTPIQVELSVSVGERPAPAVETAAYFVVAEALANAAKHARASRVDIRIVQAGQTLVLDVTDNGAGGADPGGSGLSGLRRRVHALDGKLTITSPPGGPTTVRAEIPCA
jgi:signal transduction histidine kinase